MMGTVQSIKAKQDTVCLGILLLPEESRDPPQQIWEYRIGDKVAIVK